MKKLLLLKLLLLTAYCGFSQATYDISYAQNAGYPGGVRPTSSTTTETSGWTTILPGSAAANAWTPSQTLPFAFNFFGQPVTNFKASANMLVTFDVANTALPSANTNLPTATLPDNTIAAFWDEFTNAAPTGSNDVVHTRVFGTAPNRQLWIVWFSFEYGNPNISFAYNGVVLEETTNKVYVVNIYNEGTSALTTTVGLQRNSTTAVQFGTNQLPLGPNTSANVADVDYYEFSPRVMTPADASVTALLTPVAPACYSATQPVEVTIKNFGTAAISNVPVSARITGGATPQTITTTYAGTLAPNATANVVIGNANMAAVGTYNIKAYTALATDGFRGNDTLANVTRVVEAVASLPQTVNFTGFTGSNLSTLFPGWRVAAGATLPTGNVSGEWTSLNFGNVSGVYGTAARVNIYTLGMNDWIVGPKILATSSTALKFDLALTQYAATTSATLGSDDQFKVMVSTDCGATWTAIRTYSASTPISNIGQTEHVSLSAYAGQEISVAFFVTEGTVDDPIDVDLFLDNILLGTPPAIDLGLSALVAPTALGCYTATQDVIVSLTNASHLPLDFATNPATITVNVTGAATQTLSVTINTGTLASGASQNVTVGTLNMSAAGTYTLNSSLSVTGDGNAVNNALSTATRTVTAAASLPQNLSFTGFTGSNLTTVFPNWKEQAGATVPSGTTSTWSNSSGLGGATNVTARINLWSTGKNEWIVGPKVVATAYTFFKFKAAITDYFNLDPYTGTMDSDDKVQVMLSTDCGLTFTPVFTLEASNTSNLTNVLTEFSVPLSTYAGQQIIVAIKGSEGTTSGTQDYDFHIDDLSVIDMPPLDLGAVALTSPTVNTGCYGNAEPVSLTIRNFGATAVDFAATPATVTVNVTGAVTQTFPLTLSNNTLNGGAPLAANATLTIPLGTLNMQTLGTYTFNGDVAITGDAIPANNAIAAANIAVVAPVAGTISASTTTLCNSGTSTLTLAGNNGGNIQWQQATTLSGPYTDITGATGQTYTTTNLTATAYYQAVVSCGTSSATATPITITVNNPLVTASSGATVCSGGTATISATPSAGATISWFSAATGGTPLATGNTYSPVATGPVTYYAQASIGSSSGLTSLNAHPLTGGNGCTGGSMFNVNPISTLTINSFDQNLNATAGTSVTVNVHYKTGSYLGSETTASAWTLHQAVTVISAGPNSATSIPINPLSLAAGQNYAFYIEADVSYTTITAPITYSNADLNIVVGAGLCSSFGGLNANRAWNGTVHYTAGCPSPRVPVAITTTAATAAPTVAATTATTFCAGDSVQLTATSGISGATFQWNLNGNTIPGATGANFMALTAGSYTVVAIDNGCISAASTPITVTVTPKPATPTITRSGAAGHTLTSSAATGNQWFKDGTAIAGATAQTYTATANGNYTVVVTQNNCSSNTSAAVNITNTGVRGELAGMSVSVYPNPNNGQFNVKLIGYKHDAALELYSLTGQLIVKENVKAGQEVTAMQVKNLAAGTYLLKVVSEKGVQISKLIVE